MELIGADTSKEIAFKQEEPTNEHIILSREITPKLIEQMHRNLLNEERRLSYLLRQRLISFISIRRYSIGFDTSTERYSIPIKSISGRFTNIKLHNSSFTPKSLYFQSSGAKLFPISSLSKAQIVICEGEFDCLALLSLGINAITSTSGASSWNESWNPRFFDKNVKIVYDTDKAGIEGAELLKDNILKYANSVEVLKLPSMNGSKVDITDFLVSKGNIFRFLKIQKGMS